MSLHASLSNFWSTYSTFLQQFQQQVAFAKVKNGVREEAILPSMHGALGSIPGAAWDGKEANSDCRHDP